MADENSNFQTPQDNNERMQPQREVLDTEVDIEAMEQVEGKDDHFYKDNLGRLHIIKSPELDEMKRQIELSSANATEYVLKAKSTYTASKVFSAGAVALFIVFAAKNLIGMQPDYIDFSLGAVSLGLGVFSHYRAKQFNSIAENQILQNTELNITYSEEAEKVYRQLQDRNNQIMFR